MIFKFGSSVQAACIYPTAPLKQVTNGNMCSFYFYKAGRTWGRRAELVGFEISLCRGRLLSEVTVMSSGSFVAAGPDLPT